MDKRTFEREWEELQGEGFTMVEIIKLLKVALQYEIRRIDELKLADKDDKGEG